LWHATWEGDESELRRVDPRTGAVLESVQMPPGVSVSGLESDGGDRFFCGGGGSGKGRTVRRAKRGATMGGGAAGLGAAWRGGGGVRLRTARDRAPGTAGWGLPPGPKWPIDGAPSAWPRRATLSSGCAPIAARAAVIPRSRVATEEARDRRGCRIRRPP